MAAPLLVELCNGRITGEESFIHCALLKAEIIANSDSMELDCV